MGYSAILRRSGILRSRKISCVSLYHRNSWESDANPSGGVSSPWVPWLMLPPAVDGSGTITYNFHCLAKKEEFPYTNKNLAIDMMKDVKFVGSSHGRLALFNRQKMDLFLSDPITDRHIKLPPLRTLGAPERVILSSDESLALMTYGRPGKLAFCSPLRSKEWTLIHRHHAYDNIVYSSRHKRLFCVCQTKYNKLITLECWDFVHHHYPTLDWEIERNKELEFGEVYFQWPEMSDLKCECFQIKYLVCAEHSGDLFLVVRHVNRQAGPFGSFVSSSYDYNYGTPYKTVDFDVYKIDTQRREVMHMKHSLQGLAMFVGINQPFAIPAEGLAAAGVMPNSVYFADENRLAEPLRLKPNIKYGGHDNGIFDYQNKDLHPCCNFYPIEYEKIRKILPPPLWFTPTAII